MQSKIGIGKEVNNGLRSLDLLDALFFILHPTIPIGTPIYRATEDNL